MWTTRSKFCKLRTQCVDKLMSMRASGKLRSPVQRPQAFRVAPGMQSRAGRNNSRSRVVNPARFNFSQNASEAQMKRVTGVGGIFFSAQDPVALRAWYKQHLGIDVQQWGGTSFDWTDAVGNPTGGTTAWLIGPADGKHFAPSKSTFMVNYRVDDLTALLQALRAEGCNVLEKTDDSEYGKFGWVMDPEGNKVELWQPPAGQ
jgi:predicted enzyme related to lactoylglutathione lyase